MNVNIDGLSDSEKEFFKAGQYVNNALTNCSTNDIPEDFKFIQDLKKIINDIKNIKEMVEKNRKTIAEKREGFATSEKKNKNISSVLATGTSSMNIGTNGTTTEKEGVGLTNDIGETNINSGTSTQNLENVIVSNISIPGINAETQERIYQYLGVELNANNTLQFKISLTNEDYSYLQNSIIQLYHLKDANETKKLLSLMINNENMNDYSIAAEKIVNNYISIPEKFEEQFGFKLTRTNSQGIEVLNTELIYTDIFLNVNTDLITQDTSGNNIVNPTLVELDQNMIPTLKGDAEIKSNSSGDIDAYLGKKGI